MKNPDYAQIFNSLQGHILIIDINLIIIAASDGFVKTSGIKREDMIAKHVSEVFNKGPKGVETFPDSLHWVIKNKKRHVMPVQQWNLNGKTTHWKPWTYPVLDENGEVKFLVHESENITSEVEREKVLTVVEQELLEQTRLTEILDRMSDGFFILNRDHQFTYANELLKAFGGIHGSVVGAYVKSLFPSPDYTKFIKRYDKVMLSGKAEHFIETYENNILQVNAFPTNDGVAVFFRDISKEVHAQEENRKSREKLQFITDAIPAWVGYFDREGNYQFVNRAYEEWFGIKAKDVIGKPRSAFAGEEVSSQAKFYEECALNGETISFEQELTKDGNTIIVLASYIPDIDPRTNEVRGAIAIAYDITERYLHRKKLEETLRMRDEFMSIASHELKTPLTTLTLQNQFIRRRLQKNNTLTKEELEKYINTTDGAQKRLNRLIDDMLDVSKINNGKLTFTPEKFDLVELAKDVVNRYIQHVPGMDLITCDPMYGLWDKMRIDQVISNLITNAIKYGKDTPILVRLRQVNGKAVIEVKDRGPGIAKENHERIFRRFERSTNDTSVSGLGLGLFICKEIVERHNGKISVESVPGDGALFKVELPII